MPVTITPVLWTRVQWEASYYRRDAGVTRAHGATPEGAYRALREHCPRAPKPAPISAASTAAAQTHQALLDALLARGWTYDDTRLVYGPISVWREWQWGTAVWISEIAGRRQAPRGTLAQILGDARSVCTAMAATNWTAAAGACSPAALKEA